ncbi:hypothetical protein ACJMK2_034030 [Sinanodonta woodiana]|uniref:Secreted protein n=1 Tax=Sinanodonta woodiana TaxID=1069815 RepID=A0ABD3WTT5_SINWO
MFLSDRQFLTLIHGVSLCLPLGTCLYRQWTVPMSSKASPNTLCRNVYVDRVLVLTRNVVIGETFSRSEVLTSNAVTAERNEALCTQSGTSYCICGVHDDERKIIMCPPPQKKKKKKNAQRCGFIPVV